MNTTPQTQSTDKVPIRQADGTIVMVSVPTGIATEINQAKTEKLQIPKPQETKEEIPKSPIVKTQDDKLQSVGELVTQSSEASASKKTFDSHLDDLEGSIALADAPPVYATDTQGLPPATTTDGIDWQARVDEVLKKVKPNTLDDEQLQRYRSIVLSRLRDVRDSMHTKEALQKDRASGGLGLDENVAQELLTTIEVTYTAIHSTNANTPNQSPGQVQKKVVHDPYLPNAELSALAEAELPYTPGSPYLQAIAKQYQPKTDDPTAVPSKINIPDIAPKPKVTPDEIAELSGGIQPPSSGEKPAYTSGRLDSQPISIIKPTTNTAPKPSMQEVVAKKRLVGPIDELKNMRLVDFRRLAGSTAERLAKVTDKIHEMEDVSFTKKVEAIKGWRKSPLYQQYLDIGSESLSSGTGVADVIRMREQAGKETMSLEEFEQLSDFNKHLRF